MRFLVSRADAARDERKYDNAAALYMEALRLAPGRAGLHIQCGHMLKEVGKLALAEQHYLQAQRLRPDDADLTMQLGHLYKAAGRFHEAHEAYATAMRLKPNWEEPAEELRRLERLGWQLAAREAQTPPAPPSPFEERTVAEVAQLVPELAPRRPEDLLRTYEERIEISRFGRRERSDWGNRRTLRGIEALRGYCLSAVPIVEVHVLLNGVLFHRGMVTAGYPLKFDVERGRLRKYVFNLWIDFTEFAPAQHALEVRLIDIDDNSRSVHEDVVVAAALPEAAYPLANLPVAIDYGDERSLEEQIRDRPSMIHSAKRDLFPNGVRSILVMRVDQLGDLVASIPALRRLRELAPDANIVGLLGPANAELARTLGLLDEVIVADFPDDPVEKRRLMSLDDQAALRQRLEPYAFDIALDLAQAAVSRDLLLLSGAKFLYGTGGEDWPWLSSDFLFHTRDRWTRHDFTPHSTKVLALVESLGTLLRSAAPILRRPDLGREMLASLGIGTAERFAVLHAGARIGFSRWPFYPELARMILAATDLRVVMVTEDPLFGAALPPELLRDDRFSFLDRRLAFDEFDGLLSFATVVVGNDSGPKHLAALRGTNVVTLFSARINWTEWGQENVGVVISRRLPCAGCAILHHADECGKDFACITDIKLQEVFDAVMAYVD